MFLKYSSLNRQRLMGNNDENCARLWEKLQLLGMSIYFSFRAATPGRILPSRSSREAPPEGKQRGREFNRQGRYVLDVT